MIWAVLLAAAFVVFMLALLIITFSHVVEKLLASETVCDWWDDVCDW